MIRSKLEALGTPLLAVVLSAFVAGFAGGVGALVVERIVFPIQGPAIVDLASIIGDHVTAPAVAALPEEERSLQAAQYVRRLDMEVAQLARDYNALLLAAPAVVAGAPDLTAALRVRLESTEGGRPSDRR